MVRLEKITPDNYKECLELKVADDQKNFVTPNVFSLAKAYVFYGTVTPLAIYDDDLMVGFILLRYNKEYNNYFIWQFMIDHRFQAKGYGSKALELLIDMIKKEGKCREIVTTYINGNKTARKLYTKHGFEQMGEMADDEIDMVLFI